MAEMPSAASRPALSGDALIRRLLNTSERPSPLEVNDASGEHDHYIQLHCELRYEPVLQLRALGHFVSWFFHDSYEELDG